MAVAHASTTRSPAPDSLVRGFVRLCGQLNRHVSEAELRAALPPDAGGSTAETLERLGRRFGFTVEGVPASVRRLRRTEPPYLLLGNGGAEAWVVRARTGRHLHLIEPERGATSAMTPRAAARLGTRLVVMRRPAEGAAAPGLWRGTILKRLRPVMWEIGLASVWINLLALATPIFMMAVYNKVIAQGALGMLDTLAIGMVTLFGFELALRALRGEVMGRTGAKLDLALGADVVHHLLQLPYRVFERMPSAQMMERLRQLDQLRGFLTSSLPLLLVDLLFVGLFLAVIMLLSPTLGLVTLGAVPLFVGLSALAHRKQQRLLKAGFRAGAAKASSLGETVANALTVKALALEGAMERRFEALQVEGAWVGQQAGGLANYVGAIGTTLQHGAALLIVYLGARMIVAGEMSIGALIACTILSARALAPMRQCFAAWHQLQQARDSVGRLDALMRERTEAEASATTLEAIQGEVRFERVGFAYAQGKPPALSGIDLTLPPGTMLGVAGVPGSGKSTLARLLIGLDRPSEGRVLVDGHDLAEVSLQAYRALIGVVPQDIQLFSGTIAENIKLAAPEAPIERVVAAAKFVGAHDFIKALPDGYDTVLGERGVGLSTGQRQLLCVARALARNPRLLVLDEATSALDPLGEAQLLANLKRAGSGRTIVLITHRLSALELCETAVLMEGGRIKAEGSAAEIAAALKGRTTPVRGAG